MAKKTETEADTFDVLMELHVCDADQESNRSDLTITITIDKVTPNGSVGFYGNMSKHPNSTAEGVARVRAIVMTAAKRLNEIGIKSSWLGWWRRHFVATGLSWDEMKCVQEVGIDVTEELNDMGYEHANAKGIKLEAAAVLRKQRRGK